MASAYSFSILTTSKNMKKKRTNIDMQMSACRNSCYREGKKMVMSTSLCQLRQSYKYKTRIMNWVGAV